MWLRRIFGNSTYTYSCSCSGCSCSSSGWSSLILCALPFWGVEHVWMGLNADCHFVRVRELEKRRKEEGKEDVDMEDVLDGFHRKARDHARTPMQVSR